MVVNFNNYLFHTDRLVQGKTRQVVFMFPKSHKTSPRKVQSLLRLYNATGRVFRLPAEDCFIEPNCLDFDREITEDELDTLKMENDHRSLDPDFVVFTEKWVRYIGDERCIHNVKNILKNDEDYTREYAIQEFAEVNRMNISICEDGNVLLDVSCRYCQGDFDIKIYEDSLLGEYASSMIHGCTPPLLEDGECEDLFPPCDECKDRR